MVYGTTPYHAMVHGRYPLSLRFEQIDDARSTFKGFGTFFYGPILLAGLTVNDVLIVGNRTIDQVRIVQCSGRKLRMGYATMVGVALFSPVDLQKDSLARTFVFLVAPNAQVSNNFDRVFVANHKPYSLVRVCPTTNHRCSTATRPPA